MPIVVRHDPSAAAVGLPAYLGGLGQFQQQQDQFQFGVDRFNKELAEKSRQFDESQDFSEERLRLQEKEMNRKFNLGVHDRRVNQYENAQRMQLAQQQLAQQDQQRQQALAIAAQDKQMRNEMYQQKLQQQQQQQMQQLEQVRIGRRFTQMQQEYDALMDARDTLRGTAWEEAMAELQEKWSGQFDPVMGLPAQAPEPEQKEIFREYPLPGFEGETVSVPLDKDGDPVSGAYAAGVSARVKQREMTNKNNLDAEMKRLEKIDKERTERLGILKDNMTASRESYVTLRQSRLQAFDDKAASGGGGFLEGDYKSTAEAAKTAQGGGPATFGAALAEWDKQFGNDLKEARIEWENDRDSYNAERLAQFKEEEKEEEEQQQQQQPQEGQQKPLVPGFDRNQEGGEWQEPGIDFERFDGEYLPHEVEKRKVAPQAVNDTAARFAHLSLGNQTSAGAYQPDQEERADSIAYKRALDHPYGIGGIIKNTYGSLFGRDPENQTKTDLMPTSDRKEADDLTSLYAEWLSKYPVLKLEELKFMPRHRTDRRGEPLDDNYALFWDEKSGLLRQFANH